VVLPFIQSYLSMSVVVQNRPRQSPVYGKFLLTAGHEMKAPNFWVSGFTDSIGINTDSRAAPV